MKRKPLNVISILHGLVKLLARNEVGNEIRRELCIHPRTWNRFLDDYDKEAIPTVNVIETVDGRVIGMKSFMDSPAGNYSAEVHFKHLMQEHVKGVIVWAQDVLDATVEDGIYDDECGYQLVITHSIPA